MRDERKTRRRWEEEVLFMETGGGLATWNEDSDFALDYERKIVYKEYITIKTPKKRRLKGQ